MSCHPRSFVLFLPLLYMTNVMKLHEEPVGEAQHLIPRLQRCWCNHKSYFSVIEKVLVIAIICRRDLQRHKDSGGNPRTYINEICTIDLMARMCHNVSAGRRGRNYHKDYIYYFSTHRMLSSNHSMRYKLQLTLINLIVYIHQQGFPLIKTIFAQELYPDIYPLLLAVYTQTETMQFGPGRDYK